MMTGLNGQLQDLSHPIDSHPLPEKDDKSLEGHFSATTLLNMKKKSIIVLFWINLTTPSSSFDQAAKSAGLSSAPFLAAFSVLEVKTFVPQS